MTGSIIVLAVFALIIMATIALSCFTVRQQTAVIVERFGKFARVATAGLNLKLPLVERAVQVIDLKTNQLDLEMETKTEDNVFVRLVLSVQYYVRKDKVQDAYYKLQDHVRQIKAYVFNEVRAHLPKMTLDKAYESNEEIAQSVANQLRKSMSEYGYEIVTVLVRDIDPDAKVKESMNEINAAQRFQEAAKARGEGEKILVVKKAEGEAESKKLQGEGVANQRTAIIAGLQQSLEIFQKGVEGVTAKEAMDLVLITQYFDTIKEIGANNRTNTIFIPHSPSGLADVSAQIRDAFISANAANVGHTS